MLEQWYPKSREEKAQYKKIRKTWNKQYKKKKILTLRNFSICLAFWIIAYIAIKLLFPAETSLSNNTNTASENNTIINNNTIISGKKIVSNYDEQYLRKVNDITKLNEEIKAHIIKDLTEKGYADYKNYTIDIEKTIEEIEKLQNTHIGLMSDLKPYEKSCTDYFEEIKRFYIAFQYNEKATIQMYNNLINNLKNIKNPYNHLIELFELNNYDYSTSDDSIHYICEGYQI